MQWVVKGRDQKMFKGRANPGNSIGCQIDFRGLPELLGADLALLLLVGLEGSDDEVIGVVGTFSSQDQIQFKKLH